MTDPISNERLAEMLAGLEGVTPGPWRMVTDYPSISIGAGDYRVVQTANQNNHRRFGTAERWIGIEHETNATHIARCDPDTIRSLIEEVQASRRQSPAGVKPGAWTMRINYGPDGEANYANVYSGTGEFVGNLKVHHAGAIVDAFASPPPKAVTITDAARDVLTERRRQIEAEGWTPEHDDQHANGEMAAAAACYAFSAARSPHNILNTVWPWSLSWWKPKDKRRDLVKAAALILAEIERLDRAAALSSEAHNGQ